VIKYLRKDGFETMAKVEPKFHRGLPDERRALLIRATIDCLATNGHAGVSVRRIAAAAGVSAGLINHYFVSIDDLVAQSFDQVATEILRKLGLRVDAAGPDPRLRLSAYLDAYFSPLLVDQDLIRVWVVFWSLIPHSAELREIQKRSAGEYRALIERELAAFAHQAGADKFDAARAALGLFAMLDGLWLELCLNPLSYPPAEGVILCRHWIDGELGRAGMPPAEWPPIEMERLAALAPKVG
jgi:TetR/AcrR family transcriptional repressor of bet genes